MSLQLRTFFARALTLLVLWTPASYAFVCETSTDLVPRNSWDQNLLGWTGLIDVKPIRCDNQISTIYYDWVNQPSTVTIAPRAFEVLKQIETLGPKAKAIGGTVHEILVALIPRMYEEGQGRAFVAELARLKVPGKLIADEFMKPQYLTPTLVSAVVARDFTAMGAEIDLRWQMLHYYRTYLQKDPAATAGFLESIKYAGNKSSGYTCKGCVLELFDLAQDNPVALTAIEARLSAELASQKADARAAYVHQTYMDLKCETKDCILRLMKLGFDPNLTIQDELKRKGGMFGWFSHDPYDLTVVTALALESPTKKAEILLELGAKASDRPELFTIALQKGLVGILEKYDLSTSAGSHSNTFYARIFSEYRRELYKTSPMSTMRLIRFIPARERVATNEELTGLIWYLLSTIAKNEPKDLTEAIQIIERDLMPIAQFLNTSVKFNGYFLFPSRDLTQWFPAFVKNLADSGKLKPGQIGTMLSSIFRNNLYQISESDRDAFLNMILTLRQYDRHIELDMAAVGEHIKPSYRVKDPSAFIVQTRRAIREFLTLSGYKLANARRRLKGEALKYPPRSYVSKPYTTIFEFDFDGIKTKVDIAKTTREAFAFLQAQKRGYNAKDAWLAGARALAAKHFARSKDKSVTVEALEKILIAKAGNLSTAKKLKLAFDGIAGKPLAYNKDAVNIFDAFTFGKLQCSSGTSLFAYELLFSKMQFDDNTVPVVIHTEGHALPGFLKRDRGGEWSLIGVETTVDGEQIVPFGLVKDNKVPMAVVELSDHYASEVLVTSMLDAVAFEAAVLQKMKARYGFKTLESSFALPPGADAELNNNLFAFGSANVPAGDQSRTPTSPVTVDNYQDSTPLAPSQSRQKEIIGEAIYAAAPNAPLNLESVYNAILLLTRSADKALQAANLMTNDSFDHINARSYRPYDYGYYYDRGFYANFMLGGGLTKMDRYYDQAYSYGWSRDVVRCLQTGNSYFYGAPAVLVTSPADKKAAYAAIVDEGGYVQVLCDFGADLDKAEALKRMQLIFKGMIDGKIEDSTPVG